MPATNLILYSLIFIFFFSSILGYGITLNKYLIKNQELKVGESGIFGFIALYLISVFFHFFISINILFSSIILISGLFLFFKNSNLIIREILNNYKIFFTVFFLFFLLSITNNLHDDAYLYQLPYINYLQSNKIIFGLVSLNDFAAYSHGLYDVMSLFKLPIIENQAIFTLPVIFVLFFSIFLIENLKINKNYFDIFIYIIFFLILFKFTRSKQYGTDVPIICLIFMIQIYILNFLKEKNQASFLKSIILFIYAIFLKLYAVFAIFYFFVFFKKFKKNLIILFNNKKIIFFIFFISFITFTKNIIHSGCAMYPVTISCFEKNDLDWSLGKDAIDTRKVSLEAAVKGIRAYIRSTNHENIISPQEYLSKYRYTYLKNVIKDPDFERFLIIILIFLVLILINLYNSFTSNNQSSNSEKFDYSTLIFSALPFLAWLIYTPHLRYGGYAYIIFLLYLLCSNLNLFRFLNKKNIKLVLVLGLIFFSTKNLNRIQNEYINKKFSIDNYPFPKFKEFKYKTKKINGNSIYLSNHWQLCGEIPFPCTVSSIFNTISKVEVKNGYYFISSNEEKIIKHMKNEIFKIHYKMNF